MSGSAGGLDVVVVGESLGLLTATRTGGLAHVREMRLGFGGAESNVAIGVARLGGTAGWIGRVGADAVGDLILRELRAESVEVHAARDAEAATALMLKERPQPGASSITYYRRDQAGSRLTPRDVPADVIARARVLHVTGISPALGDGPGAAVHAAIDHARSAGVTVSVDINHRSRLWEGRDGAAAAYRRLAERADILFAGDDEAALLTGVTAPDDQLRAIRDLGPAHAIVKLGARGAIAASADGEVLRRDALRVPVVDTVGAGDAFVAGWLTEFARGADAATRLDTAIACGALACTAEGDWEAAPTRAQLQRLSAGGGDPVSR